jgi:hypothetical protein
MRPPAILRVVYTIGRENNFGLGSAVKRVWCFLHTMYTTAPMSDIEEGEIVEEDFDDDEDIDIDMEDFAGDEGSAEVLASTLATPDGDTVCTALLRIGDQLEMQNKILIKILSKLT